MSANMEQIKNDKPSDNALKKYELFLRVCYGHKSKLRSFECFPSFKELINSIADIYPNIKHILISNHIDNNNDIKKDDDKIINNNNKHKWRLQTDDADWIETDKDWDIIIEYLSSNKSKINNKSGNSDSNSNSNPNPNGKPANFTLHVIIENQKTDDYNPEMPSFEKCFKNPLSLIYQRPPPPPYQPELPPTQAPSAQPLPHPHHHQPMYSNHYTQSMPYYTYPTHPQPTTHYQPPYATGNYPVMNHHTNTHHNVAPVTNNVNNKRPIEQVRDSINNEPPTKKRKLNQTPVTPPTPATATATPNKSTTTPTNNGNIPPPSPPATTNPAIPTQPPSITPSTAMPTGPPPTELCEANPYGIVHMNGYVWCDACNRWFEIHCFDSHLQGKKHKKNIDAFSFRKVLKHWQKIRTEVVEDPSKYNLMELSQDNNLWYAQICLSCLSEVHYSSWKQHITGQVHQNNFTKYPRRVVLQRKIAPGNENSGNAIPTLFSEKYFSQIANYVPGSKILILGEQDFSYSLAICNILQTGKNIVGTSYLGAFDQNSLEPEEHPADDGIRANYFRKTLPSHNGELEHNLNLLSSYGADIAHSIDATKLLESLSSTSPRVYCGPFDIIVFPFPRASLKRGLDFRNSTLIQGFFNHINMYKSKLLYPLSQIQMIVLDNQFKEWDTANIAKENGWILKWRCCINFSSLKYYKPRELSGKEWGPKTARLLVFLWDNNFNKNMINKLNKLNQINDLALLPDEAMKVKKKAQLLDAYHAKSMKLINPTNT